MTPTGSHLRTALLVLSMVVFVAARADSAARQSHAAVSIAETRYLIFAIETEGLYEASDSDTFALINEQVGKLIESIALKLRRTVEDAHRPSGAAEGNGRRQPADPGADDQGVAPWHGRSIGGQ